MSVVDTAYRATSGALVGITLIGTVYFAANIYKGYDFLSKKKRDAKSAADGP